MRYTLTAFMLAGILATSASRSRRPRSHPRTPPRNLRPSRRRPRLIRSRASKSVDASSLVITKSGKKGGDMTFKLDSTTQRDGSITTGSPVSVRYRMDGSSMVATAVNAEAPKASKTAK